MMEFAFAVQICGNFVVFILLNPQFRSSFFSVLKFSTESTSTSSVIPFTANHQ